mmetsp:Transcript_86201/g.241110  ORF Transcript_86201/g.241110 Transcript_86201/m.241110 type:complete len:323 (+) Transcript_86201:357-1325(+)
MLQPMVSVKQEQTREWALAPSTAGAVAGQGTPAPMTLRKRCPRPPWRMHFDAAKFAAAARQSAYAPNWVLERLAPTKVDRSRCLARVRGRGLLGEQCRCAPVAGTTFCAKHGKRDKWRVYGRVDRLIPKNKLRKMLMDVLDGEQCREKGASKLCDVDLENLSTAELRRTLKAVTAQLEKLRGEQQQDKFGSDVAIAQDVAAPTECSWEVRQPDQAELDISTAAASLPQCRRLSGREKADLQDKLDALSEQQLERVFQMLHKELGVAVQVSGEVDLDIDNLLPDSQRQFMELVDVEFKRAKRSRVGPGACVPAAAPRSMSRDS